MVAVSPVSCVSGVGRSGGHLERTVVVMWAPMAWNVLVADQGGFDPRAGVLNHTVLPSERVQDREELKSRSTRSPGARYIGARIAPDLGSGDWST